MSFSNVAGCDAKLFPKLREPLKCPLSLVAMPGMHEVALVLGGGSPDTQISANQFSLAAKPARWLIRSHRERRRLEHPPSLTRSGVGMCTLTILRDEGRVLVTMNRDDLAGRPEAAPSEWRSSKPTFVAPKDLQAGGTWIGVNAYGIIACLLNRYDAAPAGRTSRGSIVLEAMRNASVHDACNALKALDHAAYSPFTCLLVGHDSSTRLDWTGARLAHTNLPASDIIMVTSSSWKFDEVKAKREGLFRRIWANGGGAADRVATFHSRRDSAHDAWAPMMQRPQSQTKSVTQVELTAHGAEMRYWTRDAAIARQLAAPDASLRIPTSVHRDGRVQM